MLLDGLTPEILMSFPSYLDSIEDVLALSSTSRALYNACANPPPKVVSRLIADSGRIFFRPHPHLLIAATARELATWAVQSSDRRYRLEEALSGGVDKLLELAIDVVGLAMADIRRLWRFKFEVLNPLDRKLDLAAGPSSGKAWTVCNDPETTLVSFAIYGELFHHDHELGYLPIDATRPRPLPLSSLTRYQWFVYCVPDYNSFNHLGVREQSHLYGGDQFQQLSMQTAMRDPMFDVDNWGSKLVESAPGPMAPVAALDYHQQLVFSQCAKHWGFRSLELLVPGGPERLADDIRRLAAHLVDALPPDRPEDAVDSDSDSDSSDFDWNSQASDSSSDWESVRNTDISYRVTDRNTRLRKAIPELVQDRWWYTAFPDFTEDLHFTLWAEWNGGKKLERELKEAIGRPAERTLVGR
ncbi:hypothetical protein HMN09_01053700 [Mycena chlorophos]|uniref:F-box domain-containing protein n=1 Tax=Mycena chlorophos TaxID=658473 RepID=A0A8H6SDV0_MYCCL|nr:hypothetical protein HMN09_01053700 [Mycena chlorophos]